MGSRARYLGALALVLCLLGGCGGGDEQGQTTSSTAQSTSQAKGQGEAQGKESTEKPQIPPGTSPADARQIKTIAERFPPPKGESAQEQAAIEAGEAACEGKTPLQVKEEFYGQAEAQFDSAQKAMIEEIEAYEDKASRDLSYAAGQLGAVVYEKSLPEGERSGGFRGCAFVLARGLVGGLGGG